MPYAPSLSPLACTSPNCHSTGTLSFFFFFLFSPLPLIPTCFVGFTIYFYYRLLTSLSLTHSRAHIHNRARERKGKQKMAEERTIESLREGCQRGEPYSALTRMEALLVRRFLAQGATGAEEDCYRFILTAMATAAVPFLAADVAAHLSGALLRAFARYQRSLDSDYADSALDTMLEHFTGVVVGSQVDFTFGSGQEQHQQKQPFAGVVKTYAERKAAASAAVAAAADTDNGGRAAVSFQVVLDNTRTAAGGRVDDAAAATAAAGEKLAAWAAVALRWCEAVAISLAVQLLPSSATHRFLKGYPPVDDAWGRQTKLTEGIRVAPHGNLVASVEREGVLHRWAAHAAKASFTALVCIAAAGVGHVSVPPVLGVDSDNSSLEEPQRLRRDLLIIASGDEFPSALGIDGALRRLQLWATCSPPLRRPDIGDAHGSGGGGVDSARLAAAMVVRASALVSVLRASPAWQQRAQPRLESEVEGTGPFTAAAGTLLPPSSSPPSAPVTSPMEHALGAVCRLTAATVFDALCRSAASYADIGLHDNKRTRVQAYGATAFFVMSRETAVCTAEMHLAALRELVAGAAPQGLELPWVSFLASFIVVLEAALETNAWPPPHNTTDDHAKKRAREFLQAVRSVTVKYRIYGVLRERPVQPWDQLAMSM